MGKPSSSDKECAFSESSGSTDKPVSPKRKQKISPNYLRASTGSCHDLCKYGIKHGFDEEDKRPWRKKSTLTSSGKKSCVVNLPLPDKKKSMVSRSSINPVVIKSSLSQNEDVSGVVKSPQTPEIIKREIIVPKKKLEVSMKQDPSSEIRRTIKQSSSAIRPSSSYNSTESDVKTKKLETRTSYSPQQVKARLSSSLSVLPAKSRLSSTKQSGGNIKEKGYTITTETIKKQDERKMSNVNTKLSSFPSKSARNNMASFSSSAKKTLASNTPLISKTAAIKTNKVVILKTVSHVKETEDGKTGEENVPEKTLHVVEVQTNANLIESIEHVDITPPLSPTLSLPQGMSFLSHEEDDVLDVNPNLSPVLSLHLGMDHEEVVVNGLMKDDIEPGGDVEEKQEEEEKEKDTFGEKVEEVEEDMETEENSDDDDDEEEEEENMYESDVDEGDVEDDVIINCKETIKPLKKGYILSDSGAPTQTQVKLKFKRGKILDIQSENTGPRRLRFRQRKIIEQNHINKNDVITRKNFNKRYDSDSKGNNNNNNNNTNEEKIVLRHQDSKGKKDGQGLLLNNVIEETASKLVETRKSKVKALVGAFETVISLQDSKPSVQLVV